MPRYLRKPWLPHKPHDVGSGADILRRDVVCGPSVATLPTAKSVASSAVCARSVSATRTPLACMSRIYKDHRDAAPFCLIFNKTAKLKESPIGQSCSLSAFGRYPGADTRKVFEYNCSSGAFCLLHDSFGDTVVYIMLVPGLTARDSTKFSLRSLGFLALQISPTVGENLPNLLCLLSRKTFTVGVIGDVDNAQIHTKGVNSCNLLRLRNITGYGDIEVFALHLQIDLALAMSEQGSLVVSADKGDFLPTIDSPDRDCRVIDKSEYPGIKWVVQNEIGRWIYVFYLLCNKQQPLQCNG